MKRGFSIYVNIMAIAVLMLLPMLPHHHHNMAACIAVETCETDNVPNDKHTNHGGDATSCIEQVSFVKAKISVQKNLVNKYVQIIFGLALIFSFLFFSGKSQLKLSDISVYPIVMYEPNINCLRAPPSCLYI